MILRRGWPGRGSCSGDSWSGAAARGRGGVRRVPGGRIFPGGRGLTRGANILRASFPEDRLRPVDLVRVLRVNRNQDVAFLDFAFVAAGLEFGNAHGDQRTGQATASAPDDRAAQRENNWSGGDTRTGSRYGQRADTREATLTRRPPRRPSRSRWPFSPRYGCACPRRQIAGRGPVGEQRGDVMVGDSRSFHSVDDLVGQVARKDEAENGFLRHRFTFLFG